MYRILSNNTRRKTEIRQIRYLNIRFIISSVNSRKIFNIVKQEVSLLESIVDKSAKNADNQRKILLFFSGYQLL